jgi:hypothetical protein
MLYQMVVTNFLLQLFHGTVDLLKVVEVHLPLTIEPSRLQARRAARDHRKAILEQLVVGHGIVLHFFTGKGGCPHDSVGKHRVVPGRETRRLDDHTCESGAVNSIVHDRELHPSADRQHRKA